MIPRYDDVPVPRYLGDVRSISSLANRAYTAVNIMIYHIMVNSKVSLEIKKSISWRS